MPFIILLFIHLTTTPLVHDYHFGYTEIIHNKDEKRMEIILKLFTDDLDNALKKTYKTNLYLNTTKEDTDADDYIENYLLEKTSVAINGKIQELIYLGHEYEDDVTFMYIEIPKVKRLKSITFKNRLLFELFDDQKHLVNMDIGDGFKTTTLNKRKRSFKLKKE